jgi:hypothetical protein
MKHWKNAYSYQPTSVEFQYFTEDTIAYDIETTGLSKKFHQIYLIGCCVRQGNDLTIHQFFAENPQEEVTILQEFLSLASSYSKCITFNGIAFDEPFLKARLAHFQLSGATLPKEHLDIYKQCLSMKKLLHLPSYKQKSIEAFLGIGRDDEYDGGALIAKYLSYTQSPDAETEHLLWLHNYEDVRGMVELLPVLAYLSLRQGILSLQEVTCESYQTMAGSPDAELIITGTLPVALPTPLRLTSDSYYFILQGTALRGSIRLSDTTLKYFLPDYKRYVYLPKEDMVVLKELSAMIAPDSKEKATPDTCYIKKEGLFLPLPKHLPLTEDIPVFRRQRKDKAAYLFYEESMMTPEFMTVYVNQILKNYFT